MKLSIIMPIHNPSNRIRLFKQALYGIFGQKYLDWELIMIVDNENKSVIKTLKYFVGGIPKVKILVSKSAPGPGMAKNIGVLNSSGKYLIFHDSDDYSESNRFGILVQKMEHEYSRSKIVGSDFYEDNYGKTPENPKFRKLSSKLVKKHNGSVLNRLRFANDIKVPLHFPTSIVDRKFFYMMGGFEPVQFADDIVFIIKACLFHEIYYGESIPIIKVPLFHWCRHNLTISRMYRDLITKRKRRHLGPLLKGYDKLLKCGENKKMLFKLMNIKNNLSVSYDYYTV